MNRADRGVMWGDCAIVDMSVSLPRYFVKHDDLAEARGVEPEKYRLGLGCEEMSFCGPGEDAVTFAAEAGLGVLDEERRRRVGLCIVGTESGVDGAKSIASYVHGLLGLSPFCRVFDIQHACYGGTAALQMARTWVTCHPDQLALVIAADVARYERYSPGEATQGAGAVAMLVGVVPEATSALTLSSVSGTYASDVHDFWRPTYQKTAMVRGKFSVSCYLEGLVAAHDDFVAKVGTSVAPHHMLFHAPFPHMARKAHRHLWSHLGHDEDSWEVAYNKHVVPSLWANRRVGNMYTGSLYLSLAALFAREGDGLIGQELSLFSYGSGSCSEFFTGRVGGAIAQTGLTEALDARHQVDVSTYEALTDVVMEMEQNQSAETCDRHAVLEAPKRPFVFEGIRGHERLYQQQVAVFRNGSHQDDRPASLPRRGAFGAQNGSHAEPDTRPRLDVR